MRQKQKVLKTPLTKFSTGSLENFVEICLENRGFTQIPQSFPQAEGGKQNFSVEKSS